MTREEIEKITAMIFNGGGVMRSGCYDVGQKNFIEACEELFKSGKNVLLELDDLTYLSWDAHQWERERHNPEYYCASPERISFWEQMKSGKTFWQILPDDDRFEPIEEYISASIAYRKHQESYQARRTAASNHTSNKNTRKRIFERDSYKCKKCKNTKDLTIDHIVSVKNGGDDSDENLQTLCHSCNSRKGQK